MTVFGKVSRGAPLLKKSHAMDTKKMLAEPLHAVEQGREVCVKVESVSSF